MEHEAGAGRLSVPYLGSNCLEQPYYSLCSPSSFLSVPYLGSNCLELPSGDQVFAASKAFSTLPRVELPGASS